MNTCIFCRGKATKIAVWKYGCNWTCFQGNCLNLTKRMVGFNSVHDTMPSAEARYSTILAERESKATSGRRKR